MQCQEVIKYLQEEVTWETLVANGPPFRDNLFKSVLDSFWGSPVNIFQIGAIETFEDKFRMGSGWSDLWFGLHAQKFGGEYHVADINVDHAANSLFLANTLRYRVNIGIGDGLDRLQKVEPCGIYYLDGADISQTPDAHQQTLRQFMAIVCSAKGRTVVLVDDVPTKALDLIEYLDSSGIKYDNLPQYGSGMLVISLNDPHLEEW